MFPGGRTWTFHRHGVRDRTGDRGEGTSFEVAGCVYWPEQDSAEDFARDTITARGTLAVPKGSDVMVTDRPESPEAVRHTIIGKPRWEPVHAMTGWDPGYDLFTVKAVT